MNNTVLHVWRYDMPSLEGYQKIERIDGVTYAMSPTGTYQHGMINQNINYSLHRQLNDSLCRVFIENLELRISDDEWLVPDVMITCDRHALKGGRYYGVPKFLVETLSPSTASRDKKVKKEKYASIGVDELWLVDPRGKSVEIYYLENNAYVLEQVYMLEDDPEDEDFNADIVITLRMFPNISMTLAEIFRDVD